MVKQVFYQKKTMNMTRNAAHHIQLNVLVDFLIVFLVIKVIFPQQQNSKCHFKVFRFEDRAVFLFTWGWFKGFESVHEMFGQQRRCWAVMMWFMQNKSCFMLFRFQLSPICLHFSHSLCCSEVLDSAHIYFSRRTRHRPEFDYFWPSQNWSELILGL